MVYPNDIFAFDFRPGGHIQLNLPEFFPASKGNIRKLFQKVIGLNWEGRVGAAKEILEYLDRRVEALDAAGTMKKYANKAVSAHTKAGEMQERIDKQAGRVDRMQEFIRTVPKGRQKQYRENLKQEKQALKTLKERQRGLMDEFRHYQNGITRVKREEARLKDNIELIMQLTTWWE